MFLGEFRSRLLGSSSSLNVREVAVSQVAGVDTSPYRRSPHSLAFDCIGSTSALTKRRRFGGSGASLLMRSGFGGSLKSLLSLPQDLITLTSGIILRYSTVHKAQCVQAVRENRSANRRRKTS
jgi:hypothetical protein